MTYTYINYSMDTYEYERYVATPETAREVLKTYGVAVIPGVLDTVESDQMLSSIWDYFEHISSSWSTPISRNIPESHRGLYYLIPLHSMLFQHLQIGHSQACWDVRQNVKIVNIFKSIWGSEDLTVSFDGLSFNPPPEKTNRGWYRGNTWYHTDQSFTRPEFECVQGWVTALDVNRGDATLAFMEGSHKYHKEHATQFGITDKKDWCKLSREEETFYVDRDCQYKKIYCPKGSLVLWDSRTIHCGCEALRERPVENFRAIVYVCYTPKNLLTPALLRKKKKAFDELRTTNHWPHKPKLFAKTPRTWGAVLPEITPIPRPVLTELGHKLVGME